MRTKHTLAGTFAPTWAYSTVGDVQALMLLHLHGGPIDEDARLLNQDLEAYFDNVILELNDASADPYTPYVHQQIVTDLYHCIGELKNTTNGKFLTYDVFFRPIGTATIEVNVEDRTVTYKQNNWSRPLAEAVKLSDLSDWLPLEPGGNSMTYTEYRVTNTDLTGSFRSAKV